MALGARPAAPKRATYIYIYIYSATEKGRRPTERALESRAEARTTFHGVVSQSFQQLTFYTSSFYLDKQQSLHASDTQ